MTDKDKQSFIDAYLGLCEEHKMCIDLHDDLILKTANDKKLLQVVEINDLLAYEAYEEYIDTQLEID